MANVKKSRPKQRNRIRKPSPSSSKPASDRRVPLTYGMFIWIVLFIIITWIGISVFGGPLSIIGWVMGINPILVTITIIIVCFLFILMLRGTMRGASK